MNSPAPKSTRLVARVSQDVQALINNAANISGATLSQFIVEAATTKALNVISQARTVSLSLAGATKVFNAIENPPPPNSKLKAMAERYKKEGIIFHEAISNNGSN